MSGALVFEFIHLCRRRGSSGWLWHDVVPMFGPRWLVALTLAVCVFASGAANAQAFKPRASKTAPAKKAPAAAPSKTPTRTTEATPRRVVTAKKSKKTTEHTSKSKKSKHADDDEDDEVTITDDDE